MHYPVASHSPEYARLDFEVRDCNEVLVPLTGLLADVQAKELSVHLKEREARDKGMLLSSLCTLLMGARFVSFFFFFFVSSLFMCVCLIFFLLLFSQVPHFVDKDKVKRKPSELKKTDKDEKKEKEKERKEKEREEKERERRERDKDEKDREKRGTRKSGSKHALTSVRTDVVVEDGKADSQSRLKTDRAKDDKKLSMTPVGCSV
jgi:hypothetical protein